MVGWHHWFNGHEFEQTPGNGEGQGSLACCSPWVAKSQTRLSHWTTTSRTKTKRGRFLIISLVNLLSEGMVLCVEVPDLTLLCLLPHVSWANQPSKRKQRGHCKPLARSLVLLGNGVPCDTGREAGEHRLGRLADVGFFLPLTANKNSHQHSSAFI